MKQIISLITLLFSLSIVTAQTHPIRSAADIYQAIKKLNFLGSVLYLAAHPDDENTKLIAHYANHIHARTAYLSLTRGDGGQNLIGPELRELLGVIRTQELIQARQTDGGYQYFTRANDFGFSKTPDETFQIWDKDLVLADVVQIIRLFKPDVIINRFDHRTPGTTHGHHTASALLSLEAFDIANDPTQFKDQLAYVSPWQPMRVYFNTSWFFFGSQEKFDAADKSQFCAVPTGLYDPLSGQSNSEVSARSRSKHQSQGFGTSSSRGAEMEYLELIRGTSPSNCADVFEGINTTWTRIPGGETIGKILHKVERDFDFHHPEKSLPELERAYQLILQLSNDHWRSIKTAEIKAIMLACAGVHLEASAAKQKVTPGEQVAISLEITARQAKATRITSYQIGEQKLRNKDLTLAQNERKMLIDTLIIPTNAASTNSYWLNEGITDGMYFVENPRWIGKAETPAAEMVTVYLILSKIAIPFEVPIDFKLNDPVRGEVHKPLEIIPAFSVQLNEEVYLFHEQKTQQIRVDVRVNAAHAGARLTVETPRGWELSPREITLPETTGPANSVHTFTLVATSKAETGLITPTITGNDGRIFASRMHAVRYDHIPEQTVFLPATAKVVNLDLKAKGKNIGYIEGAGDGVATALRQIGYTVTSLAPSEITAEKLAAFDAIVVGIRAYNTVEELATIQALLFNYVEAGGTMVVQYNTTGKLTVDQLAPAPLQIGRDRVTEETAEVRFLLPNHPVLQTPNQLTKADFDGWTQEIGLYFPNQWDPRFQAILSANDRGESPKDGLLLVLPHGKGHYVYTGLSFFRELPAGVPGAFRLLANILSLGK